MTVRFKFRSSVAFDSADLGGRPSISVRDLRSKIVAQKNLQVCRDSDLVISDAVTGQAFDDEDFQIPEGSSVIIKRVPAGRSLPLDLVVSGGAGSSAARNTGFISMLPSSPSEDVDVENFDDFGVDFHPIFEASLPESDAEVGNMKTNIHQKDDVVPRFSETSISRCQNFERSDLSEAMSKEISEKCKKECANEENKEQSNLKLKEEGHKLLDEAVTAVGMSAPAMLSTDLPTELRCSLCNTIFKDAVMIPCCQHSFCDKCICSALVERARCPKCSSLKCKVEDLLPNLSLRQAIEHFLDAQVAVNGTDVIPKYVPDGESGIQAKEASCAPSIRQQDLAWPHSPSATGKGSNQVMAESAYENKRNGGIGSHLIRLDVIKSVKSNPSSLKTKQLQGNGNSSAEVLKQMAGSEAGGSSKLSQNLLRKEEANWTNQKTKMPCVDGSEGSGVPVPPYKHRKGDRTCYMCGSPNHLIRDCPTATNPYPILQTGDAAFPGGMSAYGHAYWHGATIPHIRPYANIYGAPGMMPYDPAIVPVTPFGVPSYMQSLYAGMPVPYGFMRMGGVPPSVIAGAERPLTRAEFMDIQDGERKHRTLNELPDREVGYDDISEDYHYNGTRRRSHEQRHHVDKETTRSCSDRNSPMIHKKHPHDRHYSPHRRPDFTSDEEVYSVVAKHKKSQTSVSGRDDKPYYSEKSNSEVQDLSDSSQRWSREKRMHHHKSCSKKHTEKKVLSGSDSSRKSHHRSQKEKPYDTEKVVNDKKRQSHKHLYPSESGFDPDDSSYRRQLHKEKESRESFRHSRQKVKSTDDQLEDDRWEMVDGLGEDYRGKYYRKRKRSA